MGNRSKDMASAVPKDNHEEPVFDEAFSSLMDNFSSARLASPPVITAEEKPQAEKPNDNDIVISLRQLHLRRPINSSRTSRKLRRKGKTSNDLNLSVAAGSIHRPVVWPARFKSLSSSSSSTGAISKILHPARLSIVTSLSRSNKCDSENSEVEKVLSKKIITALQKNTALDLKNVSSVSKLPQAENGTQRVFGKTVCLDSKEKQIPSFLSLSECSSLKQNENSQHEVPEHQFTNGFLKFRSPSQYFPPCSSTQGRGASNVNNNTSDRNHTSNPPAACLNSPPLQVPPSLGHVTQPSAASGSNEAGHVTRSCSHEMRLEDTNVNELASYFDDLLHIPKKMSTMAEMMYA